MAGFRIKNHVQGKERIVAACDEEILGKKLQEGQIQFHVTPEFYDGFHGDEEALEMLLRRATVANFVGERTVDLAIRLGFVSADNVLKIQGVPHAQWALLL